MSLVLLVGLVVLILAALVILVLYQQGVFSTEPEAGTTQVAEIDQMIQVYIPSGVFNMSSTGDQAFEECHRYGYECDPFFFTNEEPIHEVDLDGFWIDQTEVTNVQYALCVADGKCEPPSVTSSWTHESYFDNPEFANYPVIEAEWEKAGRGTDERIYPWGNNPVSGERANFADVNFPYESISYAEEDDGYQDLSPVDAYPDGASFYGVLDMSGNVHQWVSSLYQPYPYDADDGREDMNTVGTRVVRGFACDVGPYYLRATSRGSLSQDYEGDYVSFRCASSQ